MSGNARRNSQERTPTAPVSGNVRQRSPERIASWQGNVAAGGDYRILARWPSVPGLANNARYTITLPGGTSSVTLDQSHNGGTWQLLKNVTLAANDNWKVELSDQASGPRRRRPTFVGGAADAPVGVGRPSSAGAIVPAANLGTFTWAPTLPTAGTYQIFAKWPGGVAGLAPDATYSVTHAGGVAEVTLSQNQGGGSWRYLGAWSLDPALNPSVTLKGSLAGSVSADALRFVRQPAAGGVSYILSDQVGQPQKMLDGGTGSLAWDRIATPFGESAMALGSAGANILRFPGQQYDAATGLHHNYFRDYDPSLGRYVQSDPIGLMGGLNTYAYVGGNPVSYVDPWGLKVELQWHEVLHSKNYHTLLRITPDNQARYANDKRFNNNVDKNGNRYMTLGAGPKYVPLPRSQGKSSVERLVSGINREKDVPQHDNGIPIEIPGECIDEDEFIAILLSLDAAYPDNLLYEYSPKFDSPRYNSNSYVAGLLGAAGAKMPFVPATTPGIEKPIPARFFGR